MVTLPSPLAPQAWAGRGSSSEQSGSIEQPVYAAWYRVPPNSLAHRRASRGEFTAAHDTLPLGTLVRVTRVSNGETVIVRITDRGIRDRVAKIDLCKEAAQQLGMIREGFTRVRLETIPEPPGVSAPETGQVAAH